MLFHLSQNYSYRYLRDDSNVFIITKQPERQYVHPTSRHIYTEPFLSKDNVTIRNAVLGFTSYETCNDWYARICNVQNLPTDSKELSQSDYVDKYFLQQKPVIKNIPLCDIKHTADLLDVPLIVIMKESNQEYDVFYYPNKQKTTRKVSF